MDVALNSFRVQSVNNWPPFQEPLEIPGVYDRAVWVTTQRGTNLYKAHTSRGAWVVSPFPLRGRLANRHSLSPHPVRELLYAITQDRMQLRISIAVLAIWFDHGRIISFNSSPSYIPRHLISIPYRCPADHTLHPHVPAFLRIISICNPHPPGQR